MSMMTKKLISTLLCTLLAVMPIWAQSGEEFMRSNGKLYVVVGVLLILLLGFYLYLIRLQKRIDKMEDLNQ